MFYRRLKSFKYALKGIEDLFRTQPNAGIHFFMAAAVIMVGLLLRLTTPEWCIIALCISLVFAAEAFNTALEYLTDLVSPEYHPLAGKTKDAAAAGVLFSAIGAAVAGLLIFVPKLLSVFFP